jgi:hypothetical protein
MPNWLTNFFNFLASLLFAGVVVYIIATNSCAAIYTPYQSRGTVSPTRPERLEVAASPTVTEEESGGLWGKTWKKGRDHAGREAQFLVAALTRDYRWREGETQYVESGPIQSVLPEYLRELADLGEAKEVIAVGTASQEGDRRIEVDRADRRADAIIEVLRPITGSKPLYKLNLGQHVPTSARDTSYQRRVVIIDVMVRPLGMTEADLKEALLDALGYEEERSFEAVRYSTFDFSEVSLEGGP